MLGKDFAPYSFDFALYRPGAKDARKFVFNGGLIFQGPSCPADGSFPSLTVSLAPAAPVGSAIREEPSNERPAR